MIDHSDSSAAIPARASLRKIDRRRRSLPGVSANSNVRRSANHVSVKPASPEVISSLISTLSAISPPLEPEFELLRATSVSQSSPSFLCQAGFPLATNPVRYVYNSDSASPTKLAFDMDYEIYKLASELKENQKLNPDHAIRLATWGNFPNRTPSSESFLSYPSLSNPEKVQEFDETSSMGSLSIEPGPRLFALTRESSGSACRRSLRSFKSFNLIDPKDVLFDENRRGSPSEVAFFSQAREVLDTNGTKFCELPLLTSLPPLKLEKLSSKDSPAEDVREVISRSSSTLAEVNKAMNINSVNLDASSAATDSSCKIPTRESSLRHSYGGSPSYRKRVSIRSETCGIQEARKVSFEHSIDSSTEASQKNIDISTEDEVSRRIKELKDQKRLRDRPLTIPAAEPILTFGSPETNCSISHISLSGARSWRAPDRLYESQSSWVDDVSIPKSFEPSAPSPSVVQRTNKNSSFRVSSVAKKGTAVTHSPLFKQISGPEPQDPVPPKRTNSRILRRLSRPISPPKQEKHKMTFSNPLIDERPKCNNPGDGMINDYILLPKLSQKIKFHQTGRVISFSEVGDSNGYAVFCCVGMGLTRYITAFYDELALTLKLRLITPDRPGIGASDAHEDGLDTPLSWPDDVLAICQYLKLTKFSILAHSAGAIYALATALRMPQHIRGRIHLLAPWIPPSQMAAIGCQQQSLPISALPYSQRFLRSLPTPFLRAANSSFLSATSASITTHLPKSSHRSKRKSLNFEIPVACSGPSPGSASSPNALGHGYDETSISKAAVLSGGSGLSRRNDKSLSWRIAEKERLSNHDIRRTEAIWTLATTNANPAVDLLVCLERQQSIGFRYVDITRAVVIHHGSKDTRVPVENVKWLGKAMRRCEVRVLEGEGHGLMASAAVMGGVLMEIAKEWDDWMVLVQGKGIAEKKV